MLVFLRYSGDIVVNLYNQPYTIFYRLSKEIVLKHRL